MKILLIGANGKMGQEVATVAKEIGEEIIVGIDKMAKKTEDFEIYNNLNLIKIKPDVIIDFSTCEDREEFTNYAYSKKIPYACFSTIVSKSDFERFELISSIIPVLICSNASRGMNALIDMLECAKYRLKDADVVVSEYHHKQKKDSPSGSAKTILKGLLPVFIDPQVAAFRVGSEKGMHKVEFYLEDEILEISHRATSRKVFATGAIEMAKKLLEKEKGLFFRL